MFENGRGRGVNGVLQFREHQVLKCVLADHSSVNGQNCVLFTNTCCVSNLASLFHKRSLSKEQPY